MIILLSYLINNKIYINITSFSFQQNLCPNYTLNINIGKKNKQNDLFFLKY